MATNTGEDFRIGSVKNRIQVCDVETGICKKIDTTTNQVVDQKIGKYKGIADHTDKRRDEFFNSEVDKKHS
ncbi:hypothetical protein [Aliarcobacter butzleri]|uniref:hypothetical protein n=1 Tax=Aliarcobacter butzleri TaxID=28197 RepID=UPI00125EC4B2|nr:hypothetical protein [Aliarcobacter butzleri]